MKSRRKSCRTGGVLQARRLLWAARSLSQRLLARGASTTQYTSARTPSELRARVHSAAPWRTVAGCGPCEWRVVVARGRFRFTGLTMTRCCPRTGLAHARLNWSLARGQPDGSCIEQSHLAHSPGTAPRGPVGGELSALFGAQRWIALSAAVAVPIYLTTPLPHLLSPPLPN
jgi:hypothetical protein